MWNQFIKNSRILALGILNNQLRNVSKKFSIYSSIISYKQSTGSLNWCNTTILQPSICTITAQRGMKQVGNCKRRCKDCYFVVRQERLFVMCKTHPRHKQMSMKKRQKNTWILTDATQSVKRAW